VAFIAEASPTVWRSGTGSIPPSPAEVCDLRRSAPDRRRVRVEGSLTSRPITTRPISPAPAFLVGLPTGSSRKLRMASRRQRRSSSNVFDGSIEMSGRSASPDHQDAGVCSLNGRAVSWPFRAALITFSTPV
jgi:hypothetical protein